MWKMARNWCWQPLSLMCLKYKATAYREYFPIQKRMNPMVFILEKHRISRRYLQSNALDRNLNS